jgi:hypothetical protein
MNRLVWDLKVPGPRILNGSFMSLGYTGGAWVPPGTYQVRLSVGEWSDTRDLELRADPRLDVSQADFEEQYSVTLQARDMVTETHRAIRAIRLAKGQLDAAANRVESGDFGGELARRVRAAVHSVSERLDEVEDELIQTRNESGQDPLNYPPRLDNQILYLYGHANAGSGRPTRGTLQRLGDLGEELDGHLTRLQAVFRVDVAGFNQMLVEAGVPAIVVSGGAGPPVSQ